MKGLYSIPGFDKTKNLPSFGARLDAYFEAGGSVQKTRDLATTLSIVTLCNADAKTLERDVQFIRSLEKQNEFFIFTNGCKGR